MSKRRTPWIVGPFAFIPLTQGLVATIDAQDLPLAAPYLWYAQRIGGLTYAATNLRQRGSKTRKLLYLHRLILPDASLIDHRDRDGLNNTRQNLRPASRAQNAHNSKLSVSNRSGHKGVCWDQRVEKWKAYLRDGKKQHHLGYFDTAEEAAEMRKRAETSFRGPFESANSN